MTQPADSVLNWLLDGDVSIQYQTRRDLLDEDDPALRALIATQGWGAAFLSHRNSDGSWGRGFYQPKWTSSHYTLPDLQALAIEPDHPPIRASVHKIALEEKIGDGCVGPARSIKSSDVCVCGMYLSYASYFGEPEPELESIVDFILSQQLPDGGFNCHSNRSGASHSSLHTTLSVLEGFQEYFAHDYTYRREDIARAVSESREFMLQHRLFKSHRTGAVVRQDMLRLSFPPRWKLNVLRALDCFRAGRAPWDDRLADALELVLSKRRPDGRWSLPSAHPGEVHFKMEEAGQPSRWNTLLALRVLRAYGTHLGSDGRC